jgi:glycosyltransferase involved in cell wall biosynthesis
MMTGAYFPEMSGAGLQCRELVRQLRDEVRFAVLTTTTDRTLPVLDRDARDGIPVFRVFVDPASVWSKATAALRMTAVLVRERRRFEILHLHGFSQKSMLAIVLGLALGKRIAIKLTSVGHDDPAAMKARGPFAYWCYSRARLFFGVSPRFQVLYEGSGLPRDRFRLIPNGVDVERFRPATAGERRALRDELGLPADAAVTLFIGFFSREKCPDVLFEAWARTAPGDAARVLVFVGATRSTYYEVDQRLAADIRHRASALGLAGRVVFVESTSAIDKYQRSADVFVLPSVREGLPNALLEALACGTPCVATRLDGVTDVLIDDGTSGLLVPPRDVTALQAAFERLAADPDRARAMGARGRERMARDYSASTMGRRYLAAYQELLAS